MISIFIVRYESFYTGVNVRCVETTASLEVVIEKWWSNLLIEEVKISTTDDSVKTRGKPVIIIEKISLKHLLMLK